MERLGVIGGMGPLATAYFYEKIIKGTKATKDQEHLDVIIYSKASIPDRTDYILGRGEDPTPSLIDAAINLEKAGATYLAMPCNTAHYFYDNIASNVSIPFIHMLEETAKHLKEKGVEAVTLLSTEGTVRGNTYKNTLAKFDIELFYLEEGQRENIQNLIYTIKQGELNDIENKAELLINLGRERTVILGCTELSVLKGMLNLNENYIDPLEILCEKVIDIHKESKACTP